MSSLYPFLFPSAIIEACGGEQKFAALAGMDYNNIRHFPSEFDRNKSTFRHS
jgi:hypothetical protein